MSEKISVLIPTYNRADMIGKAIQSILDQTHQDFEIIVVDDGSTDHTEKYIPADSRIIYRKVEHKGVAAARNVALKMSTSKVACWQDSDDVSSKYRLERMLKFLKESESVCVGCSCMFFKGELTEGKYKALVHTEPEHLVKRMGFASAMFLVAAVPSFLEDLIIGGEDSHWLAQIRKSHTTPVMSDIMYHVRHHRDRITQQRKDPKNKQLIEACSVLRKDDIQKWKS